MSTLTWTGFLGRDPEIRETQPRTMTRFRNPREEFITDWGGGRRTTDYLIREEPAQYDVDILPQSFARLSLATHEGRETTWHRVIAWDIDRFHHGIRRFSKGDRVEITGIPTTFETRDGRTLEQIELRSIRLLSRKGLTARPALIRTRSSSSGRG